VDDYRASRRTGAFLVIDPADGTTLAAGLVGAPLPVLETPEPDSPAQPAAESCTSGGETAVSASDHDSSRALVSPGP
jgi:sulfate adenylyltransferase subunit 1